MFVPRVIVALVRFLIIMFSAPGTSGYRNISCISRISNPAITVLEYVRPEPMKKMNPLCKAYYSYKINCGKNMETDLKMNCCLLN